MAAIDYLLKQKMGSPVGSNGKESACNAGGRVQSLGWEDTLDNRKATPARILGLPSWLSCKNPPAMGETWVQSLDWEDPLEKGKATHSRILAWRIPV